MAGLNAVGVAVVWDEAAIRKTLPPGIEPVKGMTAANRTAGSGIRPIAGQATKFELPVLISSRAVAGQRAAQLEVWTHGQEN